MTLPQVAAITFTEKAAYDLKKKLREEIAEHAPELIWELDRATVGTIHSFCGELLREHAMRFGIDPSFTVLDEREAPLELDDIIKDVILRTLRDGDEGTAALVQRYTLEGYTRTLGAIDYVRQMIRDQRWHAERYANWSDGCDLDVEKLRELASGAWDVQDEAPIELCDTLCRLASEALRLWRRHEHEENFRDFDSLILDVRRLVSAPEGQAALEGIRRRYRLLIIDEFQDTDGAQRDIAFAIAGIGSLDEAAVCEGRAPQLFLVGDAKQSIYRFRHADISVWNAAKQAIHGNEKPLQLTHNFRSDPAVVSFVNRVCEPVLTRVAKTLQDEAPESAVEYVELVPARDAFEAAEVEWFETIGRNVGEKRLHEGRMVAARMRQLVDAGTPIVDPDGDGVTTRPCAFRDMAVLFRARHLEGYEQGLQEHGIPYYLAGDAGVTERQEIVDLLNVLRLLENPRDDLRAFAFLRSPFVGLRDEVIARARLEMKGQTLLRRARNFLNSGTWTAPDDESAIIEVEREALRVGLDVIEEMAALRSRLPIDHIVEEVLDRTGYREHLLLMDQPEPKLANIARFLRLLQGYRNHTASTFLEIWERWEDEAFGIPQAPLYSKEDDVVTLSTIHSAKGLEWPIVFLVDNDGKFSDKHANKFWSDRELGPVLCPRGDERGARTLRLHTRADAEELAEEARLLYVATTRARDRLIVAGSIEKPAGAGEWLQLGLTDDMRRSNAPASVTVPDPPPEPGLAWLTEIEDGATPLPLVAPLPVGRRRWFRSATELMSHQRNRREWKLKYWHGVTPAYYFAPESEPEDEIPAWVRGVVIHGVLERLQDEAEIAELLDETIGALDSPELEERMAAGTEYRLALVDEIARVAGSDEWKWYTEGEHYRELTFAQLVSARKWRVGAFDLFRPGDPNLIIDFKTHEISADQVDATANDYWLQVRVYRAAARALAGETRVQFHFTGPNAATELD
jgi:ATP-dependent helicase/nuclease subunit A